MLFLEVKFYFNLGRKKYDQCKNLIDEYYKTKGNTYKFNELSLYYYREINDEKKAFYYFMQCIVLKKIDKKLEDWGINFFIEKNVSKGDYQLAAKNAMAIGNLENLDDDNRVLILKILNYIKEVKE